MFNLKRNKMKKVLLVLMTLIVIINANGQKPSSLFSGVNSYRDDKSIYVCGLHVSADQIPELIKIFELGDKLADYCKKASFDIDVNKEIGVMIINGIEHKITFRYSGITSSYIYSNGDSKNNGVISSSGIKFVDWLTIYRDKYYAKIDEYNQKVALVNTELDAVINQK